MFYAATEVYSAIDHLQTLTSVCYMVSGAGTQKSEYGKAQGTDPHEFWLKQRGGLMAQMVTTIQDLLPGSRSREEVPPDTDCNTSERGRPRSARNIQHLCIGYAK